MPAETHTLALPGSMLVRGFWLYVWEISLPRRAMKLYYVGRTGDSSSMNAQSPFNRMGQHLGFGGNSNMLRRHLEHRGVQPERCSFRLIAHGPILGEAATKDSHRERRDLVAALEKALADAMLDAGYDVVNTVNSSKPLDNRRFSRVRSAFAREFPALRKTGRSSGARG